MDHLEGKRDACQKVQRVCLGVLAPRAELQAESPIHGLATLQLHTCRRNLRRYLVKIALGIIAWIPLVPSTTWVTTRFMARLQMR